MVWYISPVPNDVFHPSRLVVSPSPLSLGHRSFPSLIFDESGNGEFLSDDRKEINYKRRRACARLRVKNRGCILGVDPSRRREKDEGWVEE